MLCPGNLLKGRECAVLCACLSPAAWNEGMIPAAILEQGAEDHNHTGESKTEHWKTSDSLTSL